MATKKSTAIDINDLPPDARAQIYRQMADDEETKLARSEGTYSFKGVRTNGKTNYPRLIAFTLCYGLLITGKGMQAIGKAFEDGANHLLQQLKGDN